MKGAIRYKVTVSAVVERVEKTGREWKAVTNETGAQMAYTPEIEQTVRREVEIYEQVVETIDMAALVMVVNGLAPK